MSTHPGRPSFSDPALDSSIRAFREVNNRTNLGCLLMEYAGIVLTIASTVVFAEWRASWGVAWGWNVPVFAAAIVLIGGFQHRLAGLGHEASHYTLMRNKRLNDLVADVFCMFPLLTNIHFYRLFHLAHHQYTNDWRRDPDLVNMGRSKGVDAYPMPWRRVVWLLHLRAFSVPIEFFKYQWDYIYVNVLGKGDNVYMTRVEGGDAGVRGARVGTLLGIAYGLAFNALQFTLTAVGRPDLLIPAGIVAISIVAVVMRVMPDRWVFHTPFRQPYSPRVGGFLRLAFFTALLVGFGWLRVATHGKSPMYVTLLWLVPMSTTFMFYMLLRDVYQHANADEGRLTNSRVFFTDPFTKWAVFVYGQDMHVSHHLFPAIPHYHLPALHDLLKHAHPEYARQVVECHGTFSNASGEPTILDVLTAPREPAAPVSAESAAVNESVGSV